MKKKIMVVEDEIVVAEDIRNCLVKTGYAVTSVGSGEQAIETLGEANPDLILMDIRLSGRKDGIETARRVAEVADIPVIFLTAYSDADNLGRAKAIEPYGYLVKPFDRNELKCAIEMALVRHGHMLENEKKIQDLQYQNQALKERIRYFTQSEASLTYLGQGFFYDTRNRILLFLEQEIKLTKKEQLFIHLLAENRGRTIPFDRIESFVWGADKGGVDENTFRVFLWRLRSKIGKDLVKNTMGVGYRIDKPE